MKNRIDEAKCVSPVFAMMMTAALDSCLSAVVEEMERLYEDSEKKREEVVANPAKVDAKQFGNHFAVNEQYVCWGWSEATAHIAGEIRSARSDLLQQQ